MSVKRPAPAPNYTATRNACKLCTPLGACLAFKGVEGCSVYLHGSQGCATYIRRYMISHFKEPVDIASSSFSEQAAIFGGGANFAAGLQNVIDGYDPKVVGIATTCLSETIGDDPKLMLHEFHKERAGQPLPTLIPVSTPSYNGTHAEGFHDTVAAIVRALAVPGPKGRHVNLLPGMVSPADLRYFKRLLSDFGLDGCVLPDYSDPLDGGTWDRYHRVPPGGTPTAAIAATATAAGSVSMSSTTDPARTAGGYLNATFGLPDHRMPLPIGVRNTDKLMKALCAFSGREHPPAEYVARRARLLDAYVDGHKYVAGLRAAVYGEEDLVVALASLLGEIGIVPALCVSGGRSGRLKGALVEAVGEAAGGIAVHEDADFATMDELAAEAEVDLLVGSSKGYKTARALDIPLVRCGFPVHDRIGGARLHHVGYLGTQELFDRIVNAVIQKRQAENPAGYFYM